MPQYHPVFAVPLLIFLCFAIYRCAVFESHLKSSFASGLSVAMAAYSAVPVVKAALDQLQMVYECCGDKGYRDWMTSNWKLDVLRRNGEGSFVIEGELMMLN